MPMQSVGLVHPMVCTGLLSAQAPIKFVKRVQLIAGGAASAACRGGDLLGSVRGLSRSGVRGPFLGAGILISALQRQEEPSPPAGKLSLELSAALERASM